jgi:lipopolysaccharide/colanic/teichoic acid biosynthesis glycosyltransferase
MGRIFSDGSISASGSAGGVNHLDLAAGPRHIPTGRAWSIPQSGLPLLIAGTRPRLPEGTIARSLTLAVKRCVDVVAASLALVVLAPVFAAIVIGIKLTSPGPVIFRQPRIGIGGNEFELLKFRSMRIEDCDVSGVAQVTERDRRVTRFGNFLRKSNLDELPQLINVVRGEMSLVGPRPHVPGQLAAGKLYSDLVPYYDLRALVLPGLTGWAQANGYRGPTVDAGLARARVDHDVAYVQNVSLLLDLTIVFLTVWREFVMRRAVRGRV